MSWPDNPLPIPREVPGQPEWSKFQPEFFQGAHAIAQSLENPLTSRAFAVMKPLLTEKNRRNRANGEMALIFDGVYRDAKKGDDKDPIYLYWKGTSDKASAAINSLEETLAQEKESPAFAAAYDTLFVRFNELSEAQAIQSRGELRGRHFEAQDFFDDTLFKLIVFYRPLPDPAP